MNTITFKEAEKDFENACNLARTESPLFITKDSKPYLVIFDFDDFMDRFGRLLPPQDYKQLKRLQKI